MLILDAKAELGEGPAWDDELNKLYWVDITSGVVHLYDPETKEDRSINVNKAVGSVVPATNGKLLAALENGLHFIDLKTGEMTFIADPESHINNTRYNDGKCDPAGRFWVGTMAVDGTRKAGALYCLDTDMKIRKMLDGVSISNGLAWSSDNKVMYYIDTPEKQVFSFDYDIETGNISNKKTVISFPDGCGIPDGMTIDTEGMLWIAMWNGWKVLKVDPVKGIITDELSLPVENVTSCTFGGRLFDELYVTTASPDKGSQQYAGGLFMFKTGASGMPLYKFGK